MLDLTSKSEYWLKNYFNHGWLIIINVVFLKLLILIIKILVGSY